MNLRPSLWRNCFANVGVRIDAGRAQLATARRFNHSVSGLPARFTGYAHDMFDGFIDGHIVFVFHATAANPTRRNVTGVMSVYAYGNAADDHTEDGLPDRRR